MLRIYHYFTCDFHHFDAELRERVVKDQFRRVRNRYGKLYQADYSSSDNETGPFDQYEAFSFSLSRYAQSPLSEDGTLASISEASERDLEVPDPQGFDSDAPAGKAYSVLRSRYTRDGIIGGFQTTKLTFTHDATTGIQKGPTLIGISVPGRNQLKEISKIKMIT
jgi:hypothetical protein